LRYTLAGRSRIETYSSGAAIPDLCVAEHESATNCRRYLVHEPAISRVLEIVTETDRENAPIRESYHLNQRHNPDTIVFHPGGLWRNELYGSVSTVPWVNAGAKKILKRLPVEKFGKPFRK